MWNVEEYVCGSVHLVLYLRVLLIKFCMLLWWVTRSLHFPMYPLAVETCSTAQPVTSFCPTVEHETLPVQSSNSCSPPKRLAIHLQHCQAEEYFRTHQMACTNSVAFVLSLSDPAVGSEGLCTANWASTSNTGETGDRSVVWSWSVFCVTCVALCTH